MTNAMFELEPTSGPTQAPPTECFSQRVNSGDLFVCDVIKLRLSCQMESL